MRAATARGLALSAIAALVLAALQSRPVLAAIQRRLLYFPVRQDLSQAAEVARRAGVEPWMVGGRFLGWRAGSALGPPRAVALVLHGNAGSALDRLYFRDVFQAAGAVEVVLLEYPGYGPRPGDPSQASLVAAAREALTALRDTDAPVVLVGESLGSAVAALTAAEHPREVAGLFLVTPLASVTAVARRHYPWVPGALVADAYRADLALPRYPGPVGFLVAGRDEVVFADLGLELFRARTGPKRLWIEERAGHNDLPYRAQDPRWREVLRFLAPGAAR